MTPLDIDRIRQVDNFESLIVFLRDELEWPLQAEDIEELSFDYEPEELGLSEEVAVKINSIKQLRPLAENQPWGIFYIDFEPKRLPVVVLRRVLQKLVIKKRSTSQRSNMPGWQMNDLLFINSFGQQDERAITFAHFRQEDENQLPTLKVIGWDGQDTPLHLDRCQNELGYLRFDPDTDAETWRTNWSAAFTTTHRHTISTSKKLAQELAELAKIVRVNAEHILKYETEGGRFKKAMAKFKTALIHDLTEEDFADMYAQTIAYGLLYTAIRSHVSGEATAVSAERVKQLVLPTNPFLKEVMENFFDIGARRWNPEAEQLTGIDFDELGINDIISTLKDERTDFDAILRDFGNRNPNEDPVIHFYELFLKEYDKQKRKSRGVYYTPRPVVNFIVRSVNEVLKRDFKLPLGLADTTTWGQIMEKYPDIGLPDGVKKDDFFVQILDPAAGTGTFLVETIDIIYKTMEQVWKENGLNKGEINKHWKKYVSEKLLPRLYGFELMMAPYAIAHMKIGIKLYETGYRFGDRAKRVQVYLTNTLEEAVNVSEYLDTLDPAMAEEAKEANEIKKLNSITIMIGNPPYAGHSLNASKIKEYITPGKTYKTFSKKKGWITKISGPNGVTIERRTFIGKLLQDYFFVDGKPLGERNPKWLNDDYVKFIRYSQYRLTNSGIGIHGFITNHAYIDNPTFRGMRQSLMNSFQKLNIIDLHGNAKQKEKCPDGSKDVNVFQIQQGVAIQILSMSVPDTVCNHRHVWGTKEQKFKTLMKNDLYSLSPEKITPVSEMYLLCPQDYNLQGEYDKYIKINEIFIENSVGIVTARDNLIIRESSNDVWNTINDFISLEPEDARDKYQLGNDARDWKVLFAQDDIKKSGPDKKKVVPIAYRPFDNKFTYYTGKSRGFICMPRPEVMHHMLAGDNLGLITVRQVAEGIFNHTFVSRNIIESRMTISNKGIGFLYPLYLYPAEGELSFAGGDWPPGPDGRTPNLEKNIMNELAAKLGMKFVSDGCGDLDSTFGPEDLLAYIYAVFHSPTYRLRYAEFLKMDFPHVPITGDVDMFRTLCGLGSELVALHLMESDRLNGHITTFSVSGDNSVTKVGEKGKSLADIENGKGKLFINKTQYFDDLPEEVWNFHIGGYQVCYKWLADRKKAGRKLSVEDIDHYHKIVVAINETIKIMKQIDKVIDAHGGWPIK